MSLHESSLKIMQSMLIQNTQLSRAAIPLPEVQDHEALVRVLLAGICATDLELLRGYQDFQGVPGHEFIGIVERCPTRRDLEGKRVVAAINCGCGHCSWCLHQNERHCPDRTVIGIRQRPGSFAEYLAIPAHNLYPVPAELSNEEAVFAEPLAAALEVTRQIQLTGQEKTAILGDGALGLLSALALKRTCPSVILFGKHPSKLSIAKAQGISTHLLSPQTSATTTGCFQSFDLVIEATGRPQGIETALDLVRPEGTIILKSTCEEKSTLDLARIVVDEITLLGSRCGDPGLALKRLQEKDFIVLPLIEAVFPFSEYQQAFARAGLRGGLKVLIDLTS